MSDTNNVQQLEKKLYIPYESKRNRFKNDRKKLLCCKIFELVTRCGGEAFFQYSDESDRTHTYATSDAMWEKYLTTGVCPGSSDSWMDNTGIVLNQITYLRAGSSKWQGLTKPSPLTHNTNGNALSCVDRKSSSFSCVKGDIISLPQKQVLLPPTNVSSSAASEIVSSSSTSITLLLPSSALSSVHLTNAENLLGKTSTSSTFACSPAAVAPVASSYVQHNFSSLKQTIAYPSSVNQPLMFIPQSNPGMKTQTIAVPTAGQAVLMPIQGSVKKHVSLLSAVNKTILMPYSHLEKSTTLQPVSFPVTYTDLSGDRKVTVSQTQDDIQQKKIVSPPKNSDPYLPVFSLLVSKSAALPASSKVLYTSAAVPKQPDKTLAKDSLVQPESSAVSDTLVASSPATVADQKTSSDVDVDHLVSSSVKLPSTSSNINMTCSITSQVSNNKKFEKPIGAKSETVAISKLFIGKSESLKKVSPSLTSDNITAKSQQNKLDSCDINNSCKQKSEDVTNSDNNSDSIDSQLISDQNLRNADGKMTKKQSDSEESGDDTDDSSDEDEDSFCSDEEEAHCEVCGELYNVRRDNKRMGRWIGCEQDCGVWVHRKCVGWTEEMVDTQSYYCDKCQLERLCRLDESL